MKIAEVVAAFPPYPGGIGYVCFHNALELARLGHEVTVFTVDFRSSQYTDDPREFKVVRLRTSIISGQGAIVPQLYSRLRGFDVVHLHYPFFGGAEYVYLASLRERQQYLLTYHMDVLRDSFLKRMVLPLYEPLFLKRIIRRATRIAALSRAHLESSKATAYVDWKKVVEIPNGVDTDVFAPREKDPNLLEHYQLHAKTVILFVGHLIHLKGLHILIDALVMLNRKDVVLFVVGTGSDEPHYKTLVRNRGLEQNVIFIGYQSQRGKLPAFYNTCDFLVLPSIKIESFGMVVLEAMASGKPAIVSSLPGPARLLEGGTYGLTTKPGDANDLKQKIELLIRNKEQRVRMGMLAREKALASYSWSAAGDKLERALLELT